MPTINDPGYRPKLDPAVTAATPGHAVILARRLDRLADFELHLGHHAAAEHMAHRAAELLGDGA